MQLNCSYLMIEYYSVNYQQQMSVNLSVVHHCLMASSTVVASCRER